MERRTWKCHDEQKAALIAERSAFGWKLVHEGQEGNKVSLTFERDAESPDYPRLKELEGEFEGESHFLPMWPIVIMSVLAFALMTALLVTWMIMKDSFDTMLFLASFGIPTILLMLASGIYMYLRFNSMKHYYDSGATARADILAKARSVKEDHEEHQDH